ncbi:S-adenosyl-L-methionine-dependent methyltransferase [Hypoxylon sp. NC0597]|nr:S-adenosyl-L-methionine-dependent methyltransferase [Hypoxylon sp. NC0597]
MAVPPVSKTETSSMAKELGFSPKQGVNWSNYLVYRPIYPTSFFERIYHYHAQKPGASWSIAHDVGAGCGIVSRTLAARFGSVIVSDPNDGYVTLARKLLVEEALLPESKFKFLQEPAEKSSVESGTVDLITACECLHWTTPDAAIKEFNRELKAGGTLAVTYYSRPLIEGSERAQEAWKAFWAEHWKKAQGKAIEDACRIANTGFENVEFPEQDWEIVKRIYINTRGNINAFAVNDLTSESKIKESEEQVWVEGDEDWSDVKGIQWFKGYVSTWAPSVPESDIQGAWDDLELALEGKQVKIRTPVAMIFATKKA